MAEFDPSRLTPRAFAALFAALFAASSLPVLLCGVLPLVDYPNHLARAAILARLPADATLQHYYVASWGPLANLAMDAIVPPLLAILPLEAAGHVFVLVTFLLLAGGTALLHRVLCGRWSAWPCLAFLLLYGRLLLWGLLNFLFGLGLALAALAAMIALGGRGVATRIAAGAAFALALYFAHLMAFGIYAVVLLGIEAAAFPRAPVAVSARLAVAALPLAAPLAIMLVAGVGGGGAVTFSEPWRKLDLMFSVFDLYHRPFDIACFALAVAGLGWAYWRRWLVLAPALALPLLLLAILYIAMPSQMLGASGVDRRLPLALALLVCAGTQWAGPRPGPGRVILAGAGAMFVLRLATVAASWAASDREYRALLDGLESVPLGSRIAVAAPPDAVNVSATPLLHLPVLAAAERDAFVPSLFAIPGQQPIAFAGDYRALAEATSPDRLWRAFTAGVPLDEADRAVLRRYDYIVFVGTRPFALADRTGLVPAFLAPRLQLYRIAG
ncbi:MAG TPA: hypothetical protein VN802_17025 [Stellaceae bacterium]|nr:hypothetical protein [Stellaceae bacterium]